jgi:hypothetical protein
MPIPEAGLFSPKAGVSAQTVEKASSTKTSFSRYGIIYPIVA